MQKFWRVLREDGGYLLMGLLTLLFFSSLNFLKDPLVWPDEAIYVEIAKNWLTTGRLYSSLFGDAVYGLKQIAAWYPPLYFYLLGGWIKLFTPSIVSVRILSLCLALLSLVAVYYLGKALLKKPAFAFLLMVLVASDYFFGRSSRIARMDILNFCLLSYSYLFYWQSRNSRAKWLWLSGVFAGLAILSHPLGLLSIVLIGLSVLWEKSTLVVKVRRGLVFGLPILAAVIFWISTLNGQWLIFWKQWDLQIQRKAISETYSLTLLRGGLSWWHLLFSFYILAFLILLWRWVVHRQEKEGFLTLGILLSAVMLLNGKEMFYPLYYQPFIGLILVYLYEKVSGRDWVKYFVGGLIGLVFLVNFQLFLGTNNEYGHERQDYFLLGEVLSPVLPKGKATLYLSALPDPYFLLNKNPQFSFREFPTMYTSDQEYYSLLDEADWVIWNTTFDLRLGKYLELNTRQTSEVNLSKHYAMIVSKLVNHKERQWPKK